MPPFFSMLTEHALIHGEVYATADMSAVAVWFHNDVAPLPDVPDRAARVEAFAGPHAERFGQLGESMDKHHPHDPHHYLSFLAVLPEQQGRGLGSPAARGVPPRARRGGDTRVPGGQQHPQPQSSTCATVTRTSATR